MKLFMLTIVINSFLFAGGDFFPVKELTKYEKMDNAMTDRCLDGCGEPAVLLPYHGEEIPIAITIPCPVKACSSDSAVS